MTRPEMNDDHAKGTKKLVTVGMYRMLGLLGKGTFARVQEAVHSVLRTKVAVKIIDTNHGRQEYAVKNLTREAMLLSMLQHPCIVRLYETIQCGSMYYLVMELAVGGDLFTHIKEQPTGRLDETMAKHYGRQLVDALSHMHSRGIVHRDLKMENIMFQDQRKRQIKLVDFGLSNIYSSNNLLKTHCGSPEYAAPELFVVGKKYGPEVDLWSLGVVLYVMTTGELPFLSPCDNHMSPDERCRRLTSQISRGLTAVQEKRIWWMSKEYKNVVCRLLTPAASKRITMRELCCHPWIMSKSSIGLRMLPEAYLSADEHEAIINDVAKLIHMESEIVEAEINRDKYGKIGGIYNIKAHKMHQSSALCNSCQVTLRSTPHGEQSECSPRSNWFGTDCVNRTILKNSTSQAKPIMRSSPLDFVQGFTIFDGSIVKTPSSRNSSRQSWKGQRSDNSASCSSTEKKNSARTNDSQRGSCTSCARFSQRVQQTKSQLSACPLPLSSVDPIRKHRSSSPDVRTITETPVTKKTDTQGIKLSKRIQRSIIPQRNGNTKISMNKTRQSCRDPDAPHPGNRSSSQQTEKLPARRMYSISPRNRSTPEGFTHKGLAETLQDTARKERSKIKLISKRSLIKETSSNSTCSSTRHGHTSRTKEQYPDGKRSSDKEYGLRTSALDRCQIGNISSTIKWTKHEICLCSQIQTRRSFQ